MGGVGGEANRAGPGLGPSPLATSPRLRLHWALWEQQLQQLSVQLWGRSQSIKSGVSERGPHFLAVRVGGTRAGLPSC